MAFFLLCYATKMADYRRLSDREPRRDSDLSVRAGVEARPWFEERGDISRTLAARERGGYWRQYQLKSRVARESFGTTHGTTGWFSDSSRASGPANASSQPVKDASRNEIPSTSTSSTTA